jgi:hypothetical protein
MSNATQPSRRMRFSFESRCRMVQLIAAGESPRAAAAACGASRATSRDLLIEELWAGAPPATVDSALHVYLSRLRRLLESAGAGGVLVREAYGYRLRVSELLLPRDDRSAVDVPSTSQWSRRVRYTLTPPAMAKAVKPSPQGGGLGTRPAGSSALLSAKRVSCAPAFLSPQGGSRFLVSGFSGHRPDAQIALPIRLRTDQAVAKCFGFLAGPELGDDLPCPTVDDDECLQGAELWRRTHQTPNLRC